MARHRPAPGARVAAWFVTGPIGHLWAGGADWLTLIVRCAWARARRRRLFR